MGTNSRFGKKDEHADETGSIRKRWQGRYRIALVYPNTYAVGMANLGFQSVYRMFNAAASVVCERVFLPVPDRSGRSLPVSVESGRRLTDFDCVAISVAFENDYINVLAILDQAGIPLRSDDRGPPHPLVIAGGIACLLNPEPLSLFIDCFLLGEAEMLLDDFVGALENGLGHRSRLTELAAAVPGIYVPAFYTHQYHSDGTISAIVPLTGQPQQVPCRTGKSLTARPLCSTVTSSQTVFSSHFLVEVGRGCAHGCRFCSAGYVYRPVRFHEVDAVYDCLLEGARRSDRIGLIGAAVSDFPDLLALCRKADATQIRLAFSSLRADALSDELVAMMKKSGVKTATIAPDAGSQRMRAIINKGLSEEDILTAAQRLVRGGIPNLKLYFMIGLPWETNADVAAIIDLCHRLKRVFVAASRPLGRIGSITVSINCFVPKPVTPFQWAPLAGAPILKQRLRELQKALRPMANIKLQADSPRQAMVQALLARGDRRAGKLLLAAHHNNWSAVVRSIPVDKILHRERDKDEVLPWDVVAHRVSKAFLWREYLRAGTMAG